MSTENPVNPLPKAVIGLATVIFGIEALFTLAERGLLGGPGGIGWRATAIQNYAFFGEALNWMFLNMKFPPDLLVRFLTYPLLHISFTHAVFVCVFILAIGKMVGEAFGNVAVLLVFFLSSIGGALAYGLLVNDPYPLVGGYPGVYGLIGGYTFLLWLRAGMMGESQITAFRLIGVLLAIQLGFGLIFGGHNDWVADLAGFATGFCTAFFLVPGAFTRLRQKLRGR